MCNLVKKATKLWGILVHIAGGHKCAMCGTKGDWNNPLEAHHIDGRNNLATKFLLELGILLCADCHKNDPQKAPHKNQPGFEVWLSETYPDKYLLWHSLRYKIVYWFEIDLKQICKDLENKVKTAERFSRVA